MESSPGEPQAKRRKVRKGTRSCWECKGRKAKCTYSSPEDTVCDGCYRRGTNCVSQELPEHPLGAIDRRRQIGNRMVRVESLIERLAQKVGDGPAVPGVVAVSGDNGVVSPSSDAHGHTSIKAAHETVSGRSSEANTVVTGGSVLDSPDTLVNENLDTSKASRNESISRALLATFPSQQSIDTVARAAGPIPSFFHQLLVRQPYKDVRITEKGKHDQLAELIIRHTPSTHPLIIARQMLLLAISFRYIHPSVHHELKGFSEPPGVAIQKIADAAIDMITTNDSMTNSLEGLECLLLAASFQADSGNLRAAWSIIRRALLAAQLMCLHRQKRPPLKSIRPISEWNPTFLWYRIVYYDRFFSLILGLPQGSTDTSMGVTPSLEDETPMGRLEQGHCLVASRLLQRNEKDSGSEDCIDTQSIDAELRKISESMPSKWWLVPNLASIQDTDQLFWATVRLTNQLFHFILLSHLHLPFLLHQSSGSDTHHYTYSRVACVNASRDLLQRYMAFRTFNHASYCCHSMDFFAITASMTLMLAHLDGHSSKRESDNALVHQRTSDRAIMEEILDNMSLVGTLNKTRTMSERGAGVLRQLLAIEADAARGSRYQLEKGDGNPSDARALRLNIPYFGNVTITQTSQSSRSIGAKNGAENLSQGDIIPSRVQTSTAARIPAPDGTINRPLQQDMMLPISHGFVEQSMSTTSAIRVADGEDVLPQFNEPTQDFMYGQSFDQGLMDGQVEWALDDVDMSIFDAILKESATQTEMNGDYWWLS